MAVLGPALAVALLCELLALWTPLWRNGFTGPSVMFGIIFTRRVAVFLAGAWAARVLLRLTRLRSWRGALDGLTSRTYLRDSVWILVDFGILGTCYTWTKVLLPAFGGALWDGGLIAADRWLCLGVNPNVFLLTIFGDGPAWAASALDRYYVMFLWIALFATAWLATDPDGRNRLPVVAGFSAVWSVGLWIYLLMPAVGPALAFEGLWQEGTEVFPSNAALQMLLLNNYNSVLALLRSPGHNPLINPAYGVAAMPSLHVAAHGYLFFWARAAGSRLSGVLLACTILTFIGSVATGWHYILDSLAGLLLGYLMARGAVWLRSRFVGGGDAPDRAPEGSGDSAQGTCPVAAEPA